MSAPILSPPVGLEGRYTPAERQSLYALHEMIVMTLTSLHDASLDPHLRIAGIMGPVYAFSLRELFRSLALLHHTNIDQEQTSEFWAREALPRSAWVGSAWFYLTRGVERLRSSLGMVDGSARTWLTQALAKDAEISRGLLYATPLPGNVVDPATGKILVEITPTVIGPHGVQRVAQWALHRGAHYFFDALDAGASKLGDTTVAVPSEATVVFQKGSEFLRVIEESMMTLAGLPTRSIAPNPAFPALQPRFLEVEKVMEWLTDYLNPFSVPFRLNEVGAWGLAPWLKTVGRSDSLTLALMRCFDAWRQTDRAAWNLFVLRRT